MQSSVKQVGVNEGGLHKEEILWRKEIFQKKYNADAIIAMRRAELIIIRQASIA